MTLTAEQHVYEPLGGARELFETRSPEVLICGPSGTGKSRAVLEKLNALCELHPGIRVLLCRKTRKSLTESVLVTYEKEVLPPGSPVLSGPDRGNRTRYNYSNGSEVVLGGLDEISRLLSSQYDVLAVNEATEITEDEWETLLTRLRNNRLRDSRTGEAWHQAIADCNPSHPQHWLKVRANRGQMEYIASRHTDNPTCSDDYLQRLSELTGVRRKRLYEGLWVAAEGLVYDTWDRDVHVCDAFGVPADWSRLRAIDFGFRDAFVCLWLALSPDGTLYVYRQWIRTGVLVEDAAAVIHGYSRDEPIIGTVCDHAAQERAVLERCGIPSFPAQKDVLVGIQEVQARLRPGRDGRPRLQVHRNSVVERDASMQASKKPIGIAEEMESYCWSDPRPGGLLKEAPRDGNDHALDALRYACMAVRLVEYVQNQPTPTVYMTKPKAKPEPASYERAEYRDGFNAVARGVYPSRYAGGYRK
jgi:phage terminase large subunit